MNIHVDKLSSRWDSMHTNPQISTQHHISIISIYILGLPMYAVSIGVVSLIGDKPPVVAGVIYNPVSSR